MTAKVKKSKPRKGRPRRGKIIGDLRASVEDDLLLPADQETGAEALESAAKAEISLRVDMLKWWTGSSPKARAARPE